MTASDASTPTAESPTAQYRVDELLLDSTESLFASTCSFDAVQAAEAEGWAPDIWDAVADAGFAWIGLPESAGGSGGTIADAAEVVRIAASHAAPIPLAETAMLGGWLLTQAGLTLPSGAATIVPGLAGDTMSAQIDGGSLIVSGTAQRVPWASRSERIVALVQSPDGQQYVASISPAQANIDAVPNLAGEPRETVHLDSIRLDHDSFAAVDDPNVGHELTLRGALSRTMLIAGALEAMSRLTVGYTNDRKQFGRPIGRFQAVQQHLVWGAQDAAIAKMAAQTACAVASSVATLADAEFQIAAARTLANDTAATATRWAHQAHGAMGMTQEYALHHLSRRLWAWRHEWQPLGNGPWSAQVGRLAESQGADGLYPLITS